MSEFLIREENFKFRILDSVPIAKKGECILLYRESMRDNGSLLIEERSQPLSAEVRRGKYNRKAVFSLNSKTVGENYKLSADFSECKVYFNVSVEVSCELKNVRSYYFEEGANCFGKIKKIIRKILKGNEQKWNIQEANEVQKMLYDELMDEFMELESIKIVNCVVNVNLDQDAQKYLYSDREKQIQIHRQKNETDVQVSKNEQEKRVVESEYKLTIQQVNNMEYMVKKFGPFAPIMTDYFSKKIDGKELYKYITEKRENDIKLLGKIQDEDWLTQQEVDKMLKNVLGEKQFMRLEEQNQSQIQMNTTNEKKQEEKQMKLQDGDTI